MFFKQVNDNISKIIEYNLLINQGYMHYCTRKIVIDCDYFAIGFIHWNNETKNIHELDLK